MEANQTYYSDNESRVRALALTLAACSDLSLDSPVELEMSPADKEALDRLGSKPVMELIRETLQHISQWWQRKFALTDLPVLASAPALSADSATEETHARVLYLKEVIPGETLKTEFSWLGERLCIFMAPHEQDIALASYVVVADRARNTGEESKKLTVQLSWSEGSSTTELSADRPSRTLSATAPADWSELHVQLGMR